MTSDYSRDLTAVEQNHSGDQSAHTSAQTTFCPVCRARLMEIRGKLQCTRCHTICETCCEGGRG